MAEDSTYAVDMDAARTKQVILYLSLGAAACGSGNNAQGPSQGRAQSSVTTSASAVFHPQGPRDGRRVDLQLFAMSQCPFSAEMLQKLQTVKRELGAAINLRVDYVGRVDEKGELSSMRGEQEVMGDLLQVCAMRHSPVWLDLVVCQAEDARKVPENFASCAEKLAIATGPIEQCATSPEGKSLLAASFKRAAEMDVRATPTLFIGGSRHDGPRRSRNLIEAVCRAQGSDKADYCSHLPGAPLINATVLADARCDGCDTTERLQDSVKSMIERPAIKIVDYQTSEGRALFSALGGDLKLPVIVFDETLKSSPDEVAPSVLKKLKPFGSYLVMERGGAWKPQCVDTGCSLDACKATLQCRPEVAGKLELFIMGRCPFGAKAIIATREVLENFKAHNSKIDFSVQFIGSGTRETGLKSLHGPDEVAEDLRLVCAIKHYAKDLKFLDYAVCRAQSLKSDDWQACATNATGIDAKVISKCAASDQAKDLLAASFAYSDSLGFGASPTWLVNNKIKAPGADAETIKERFCAHNKLAGCEVKLSGKGARPAP